jgi:hypothetical protein
MLILEAQETTDILTITFKLYPKGKWIMIKENCTFLVYKIFKRKSLSIALFGR